MITIARGGKAARMRSTISCTAASVVININQTIGLTIQPHLAFGIRERRHMKPISCSLQTARSIPERLLGHLLCNGCGSIVQRWLHIGCNNKHIEKRLASSHNSGILLWCLNSCNSNMPPY